MQPFDSYAFWLDHCPSPRDRWLDGLERSDSAPSDYSERATKVQAAATKAYEAGKNYMVPDISEYTKLLWPTARPRTQEEDEAYTAKREAERAVEMGIDSDATRIWLSACEERTAQRRADALAVAVAQDATRIWLSACEERTAQRRADTLAVAVAQDAAKAAAIEKHNTQAAVIAEMQAILDTENLDDDDRFYLEWKIKRKTKRMTP